MIIRESFFFPRSDFPKNREQALSLYGKRALLWPATGQETGGEEKGAPQLYVGLSLRSLKVKSKN